MGNDPLKKIKIKGPAFKDLFVNDGMSAQDKAMVEPYKNIANLTDISRNDFMQIVLPNERKQNAEALKEVTGHGIVFPPYAMIQMERDKPNSIIHDLPMHDEKEIEAELCRCERGLNNYEGEERPKILQELKELLPDIRQTQHRVARILSLANRILHTEVPVKVHKDYGNAIFVVDFAKGFRPSFFTGEKSKDGTTPKYKNRLHLYEQQLCSSVTLPESMREGNMRFIFDPHARLRHSKTLGLKDKIIWPCDPKLWEAFCQVVNGVLCYFAGKDKNMPLDLLQDAGFLYSVKDDPQEPHSDFKARVVSRYLEYINNSNLLNISNENLNLPYSMDMGLTHGGIRLQIFGIEDYSVMHCNRVPLPLHVPLQSAAFWRADVIHGGCLWDLSYCGGFRMHSYIPLNEAQEMMGKTPSPEIEWHARSGESFAPLFYNLYGVPF